MNSFTTVRYIAMVLAPLATTMLSGCEGIFNGVYDEPVTETRSTSAGHLYIDASNWRQWHYIDLKALAERSASVPEFNTSSLWVTMDIPTVDISSDVSDGKNDRAGIYTYWYDVFGAGISNTEYRGFSPTESQPEPEQWTFAVHRNNVRTNGCLVAETDFTSISQLPVDSDWTAVLSFAPDEWNQTDVWTLQDRMLNGIIGSQGILINNVLGRWLRMTIPPMPPIFEINRHVFILKLPDETFAALQLEDYISSNGTKCCLSINYKYPL